MNPVYEVFEIPSQSFKDIPLEQQIAFGINDWQAVDKHGRDFFGRTREEAITNCRNYH
jgi:hypothetical protein